MDWVPRWLGKFHATLVNAFGIQPFSSHEALRVGGRASPSSNLALSRLTKAGWLGRLAHGWYVALPAEAIESALVHPWDAPFRRVDFYPVLGVTVGSLLGRLGSRLDALALFGSAARLDHRPESDLDLVVVADFESGGPDRWLEELRPVLDAADRIAFRQWQLSGSFHGIQLTPFRPEQLADPGPIFLDMVEDAIVIRDRQGSLTTALHEIRKSLGEEGAQRLRDSQGGRFWLLGKPTRPVRETVA